jgi:hypothetical protein
LMAAGRLTNRRCLDLLSLIFSAIFDTQIANRGGACDR